MATPATPFALAAVAAACARYVPSPIRTVERVAGSVGNQDFLVSAHAVDYVLKAGPGDRLVAEAWACERVRRVGVSAPEIVTVEAQAGSLPLPFLLMRRFPGGPVDGPSVVALVEAGRQLRLAHEIELPGYGALAVDEGAAAGSCATWAEFVEDVTSGLDELVAADVVTDSLARAAADAIAGAAELHFEEQARLVHGDLKRQHLFADPGRLVGIIDWGDACAGDPRLDLGRLSMAGMDTLEPFLDGYGSAMTPELSRALTAYRLVWNVDALHYEYLAGGDWFASYRQGVESAVACLA